jgi:hypothetical protein
LSQLKFSQLQGQVHEAIEQVFKRDHDLLAQDVSEWAVAHRLAVYLEQGIPGWHVDCEYNRQGPFLSEKRNSDGEIIRPDISLHHRTQCHPRDNLLVVELKVKQDASDFLKACEYTRGPSGKRTFQYQFGLALSLLPKPRLCWHTDGSEFHRYELDSAL